MRFLADMGVAPRVDDWLRQEGHEALHLRDMGLARASDREIFEKAGAERRVLLTFDLDFGEIVALSVGATTSVVVFRLHDASTSHVIARLKSVLVDSSQALQQGAIVAVEETRHRVRRLPLGS